jgi:hypothetical protein
MRQRDIPRELVIGENIWFIKFVRCIDGCRDTMGICDPSEYTIFIRQGLSYKERGSTLLHELYHAISYEYGFYHMNHKHLDGLAIGLMEVFLDNCVSFGAG